MTASKLLLAFIFKSCQFAEGCGEVKRERKPRVDLKKYLLLLFNFKLDLNLTPPQMSCLSCCLIVEIEVTPRTTLSAVCPLAPYITYMTCMTFIDLYYLYDLRMYSLWGKAPSKSSSNNQTEWPTNSPAMVMWIGKYDVKCYSNLNLNYKGSDHATQVNSTQLELMLMLITHP